ncbi:small subunit ribosomal protein S5 [Algisphaera agarilytica]|uniref:Small ribosomal subunit protein uS5 n=1 Tax=Algisphaera agarilytica TaxID=1385975 RepID=A0A7X0LMH9_9BACT|nr:small subunit ribosomal protein S5 [Algisphaera agarilytica]
MAEFLEDSNALESTTVAINRTATTVKGGRRMSFSALVVVGDRNGNVGVGYGKGRGVPAAIEKSQKDAKKNLFAVKLRAGTLPHEVKGRSCASSVKLIPAAPGTGVIAGGTVRAVLEMAGVKDCLTKAYGSTNKINLCRAVIDALKHLRTREEIAALRGVDIESSTVDEMLSAAKRFMTEAETTTSKTKAVAPTNTVGKGKGKGGRRDRNDRGGKKPEAAPAPAEAEGGVAVAEAPAPEAAPEAPAAEAPAPEEKSE